MDIYKLKNNSLKQVESKPFTLEREIQTLVEANLEEIFELEFVATEVSVGDFRLDTLAFDRESSCFVIIEYKRGRNNSIIDQGYSYLSTMAQKKSDFILEYNEAKEDTLKRGDVDWDASRVMFVAPSFNSYQKGSVNFKDVPFELWEIKRFADGMVVLNQHRATSKERMIAPPTSERPDRTRPRSDSKSAFKVYTVDKKLNKTSVECRDLWNAIAEFFDNLEDTQIKVRRNYIRILKAKTTVCYVTFQKKQLRISIKRGTKRQDDSLSRGFFTLKDPEGLAAVKHGRATGGSLTPAEKATGRLYRIRASDTSNVDYLLYLLKQKYDAI